MKLISVAASPFARKAHATVIEVGLQDRIDIINPGAVSPASNNDELNQINPLGMIPALVLDSGEGLYDSPVICEYLNEIGGGSLFPSETAERFRALQLQALADGMMDVAVALRYELATRPAELQWPDFISHQAQKVSRSLVSLEQQCDAFSTEPTIGEIAVACSLGYQDFRYADLDWRSEQPKLAKWFEGMIKRDSLALTVPE